jgi:hypothetical protein
MTGRRPPRRGERGAAGGRFAIVVVVVAAVLAALFYGGDAYAHRRVEQQVAATLQTQLGTPRTPSVDVEGRPFLTQVVAQRIGEVHVVADDLGATTDGVLPIAHVDLTLDDLTTTDWWQTMTAARADGTALVDYDALARTAGAPLAYVGDGRFRLESTTRLYGIAVKATVTGRLALDEAAQTVAIADPTIEVAGVTLPAIVAEELIKAVVRPIPLEGIPFDLRVSSIDPQEDGLHVGLTGSDIQIER